MSGFLKYIWPVLIAVYIISPFDAHPLFLDDLIAAIYLVYVLYKRSKQKQSYDNYRQTGPSGGPRQETSPEADDPLSLDGACRLLGVDRTSSLDEVSRAYKEKMTKSHPDKVSHLSEELQVKAKEISLKLNEAYDLVKKHKR